MRFGETWPAARGTGGPAVGITAPARPRPDRLVAYEMWKLDQADTVIVVAAPQPMDGAS